MAKLKPNSTTPTIEKSVEVVENKKKNVVETVKEETTTDLPKHEIVEEEKSNSKRKVFNEHENVKIKCISFAGKKVVCRDPLNPIVFDENGIATVKGCDANKLLSIPGYELAK